MVKPEKPNPADLLTGIKESVKLYTQYFMEARKYHTKTEAHIIATNILTASLCALYKAKEMD